MTGARGEGTIQAGDDEIAILYTSRALAEAEGHIGRGVIGVIQDFTAGNIGYTEVAHLLRAGMEAARRDARAGGKPVTFNDALDVLDAAGITVVVGAVAEAVAAVISYSMEAESPNP